MRVEVGVAKRLGALDLAVAFESDAAVTALFGPSGVGKSSLLAMVAGLLRPDAGRIAVAGRTLFDAAAGIDLPPEARRAGMVFQDGRLFPHLTVRRNLLYGRGEGPHHLEVAHVLDLLGIAHLLDRWPRHLSGGEAQRVAIGRALLASPAFLLLDEPLAHVDRPRRDEILRIVERLRDEVGLPMLYVTHDAGEIERLRARRIDL
jgi:molybdate transport system ATP-binding protein